MLDTRHILAALVIFAVSPLAPAQPTQPVEITIRALQGLQYDLTRFAVDPAAPIRLTLVNDDPTMQHNLLVTEPGARLAIVNAAVAMGPEGIERGFAPALPQVLHHTRLLNPAEQDTITFTAPAERGVYPYVCTFPGHGFVMYGAMYVGTPMPPLADDTNVPPRLDAAATAALPFPPTRPFVQRILMPDTSPVSIAVALPGNVNYCWDAGPCRLRYAWIGDFIDPYTHWRGMGDGFATIRGVILYRTATPASELATPIGPPDRPQRVFSHRATPDPQFPLRLGSPDHIPAVAFRGYRITSDGTPEFLYTIDGLEVAEHISAQSTDAGTTLTQRFRIPDIDRTLLFTRTDTLAGDALTSTAGTWRNRSLELSPREARDFAVMIHLPPPPEGDQP